MNELFRPADADLGLALARRVIGCTVEVVRQTGECADAGLVASVVGTMNIALAVVASGIATYSLYKMIVDTARTGHAGRDEAWSYSAARIGVGAILLLPVSAGFSLAQILVIQLAIWGAGLGDTVWNRAATLIQRGGYTQTAIPTVEIDAEQRGQFATAVYARTAGWLCALNLNELGAMLGGPAEAISSTAISTSGQGWFTSAPMRGLGFTGSDFFRASNSLCGSVTYTLSAAAADSAAVEGGTYSKFEALAEKSVGAGMAAAFRTIDQITLNLARDMRSSGLGDAAIKSRIDAAVKDAAAAYRSGVAAGFASGDMSGLAKEALNNSLELGWAMAPAWQRAMMNIHTQSQMLSRGVTIAYQFPESINRYVFQIPQGPATISTFTTLTDKYRRDEMHLKNVAGFVYDYQRANPVGSTAGSGSTLAVNESAGMVATGLRKLLTAVQISGAEGSFLDPFAALAKTGAALAYAGGGAAVAGTALDWLPITRVAAAGAGGWLTDLGWALALAGFVLGGLLPLLPIVYFFAAVLGWLLTLVESLFAAALLAVRLIAPSRGAALFAGGEAGLSVALDLLLRPALIVSGLVISLLAASAGILLLNTTASSVFAAMMPLDGGPAGSALLGLAAVLFYVVAAVVVVVRSSALIIELPGAVLTFVGTRADARGSEMAAALAGAFAGRAILGEASRKALAAGGHIGAGLRRVGHGT
ncbi:DotA/TraY family protein [Xanthobacter sediminis]|uniref:DotA/TraY family protein n=1 Tax=Xanthobacter sediminis TaxID=3119926 RepID=UPI00372A425D